MLERGKKFHDAWVGDHPSCFAYNHFTAANVPQNPYISNSIKVSPLDSARDDVNCDVIVNVISITLLPTAPLPNIINLACFSPVKLSRNGAANRRELEMNQKRYSDGNCLKIFRLVKLDLVEGSDVAKV